MKEVEKSVLFQSRIFYFHNNINIRFCFFKSSAARTGHNDLTNFCFYKILNLFL